MRKKDNHKLIIWVLCIIIILQWLYIIATKPAKEKIPVKPVKPPKPAVVLKGKIAIVLDDWGYNLDNVDAISQIKYPLTIAILPDLPYSQRIASEAKRNNKEVILHLPMEPYEKFRLEKNTILTSMDNKSIIRILGYDLDNVKYAKGINNHMGSRATEDKRVMSVIFSELKNKKLYFLDSYVSPKTIASQLAKDKEVRFAKRDIFLDNKPDYEYIKGQLYKLAAKAKRYGKAIGIGHDRKTTIETLRSVMPKLEKDGYKFVYVSEIADD